MEAYTSENALGGWDRELTWVSNGCFDSVTVLEQELHQPWSYKPRSSGHGHHLSFSTHLPWRLTKPSNLCYPLVHLVYIEITYRESDMYYSKLFRMRLWIKMQAYENESAFGPPWSLSASLIPLLLPLVFIPQRCPFSFDFPFFCFLGSSAFHHARMEIILAPIFFF